MKLSFLFGRQIQFVADVWWNYPTKVPTHRWSEARPVFSPFDAPAGRLVPRSSVWISSGRRLRSTCAGQDNRADQQSGQQ
jgi:hypothetical protein